MSDTTIWKFTVPVTASQQIKIDGATLVSILDAKIHPGRPFDDPMIDIWAVVDPFDGSMELVPIEIRGTGHPLREERMKNGDAQKAHIATLVDGSFVWHVFRGRILL